MSVRPPAISSGGGRANRRAGTPPPPPPKSPGAWSNSSSGSLSRRRGDGSVMTLNLPKPLDALAPATPITAESVNGLPFPPPRQSLYQPSVSPLRLKPKPKPPKDMLKRESSMSKLNNILRQSKSFRKSSVVAPVSPVAIRKKQSETKLTRRESERIRSILKPTQVVLLDERSAVALNTGKRPGDGQSQVSTEKRQSKTKIRSILKNTQTMDKSNISSPPEVPAKETQNQILKRDDKAGAHTNEDSSTKSKISTGSKASKSKSVRLSAPQTSKERNNKEILSRLERERRKIRRQNSEYFHSRVWDPALKKDFAGSFLLANEREELKPSEEQNKQNKPVTNPQPTERTSFLTLVEPEQVNASEKKVRRRPESSSEEEWGRSVRLAMARLESKITTEATTDPVAFMKARRESAQLRAWVASRKRASEARLSALAMGRVRPNSPFEQAFVAELLRENDVTFKHSSNPLAEAERMFRNSSSGRSALLPHYTPFSQYPLLTPLEEIESEAKRDQEQAATDEKSHRRRSVFDDMKTARRAGREYKTLRTSAEKKISEGYAMQCCGLNWRPKRKKVVE